MTLSKFADIADLLTALGVMISLLFVLYELRKANRQMIQDSSRESIGLMRAYRGLPLERGLTATILKGRRDWASLSDEEAFEFDRYLQESLSFLIAIYQSTMDESIDRRSVERLVDASVRQELSHPGTLTWWHDPRTQALFTPQARRALEMALKTEEDAT